MNTKIGVGIITCDRPDYLKGLLNSLSGANIDCLYIINDGKPLKEHNVNIELNEKVRLHEQTPQRQGVAKAKNQALRYLLNENCDYIFVIEEDMLILDKNIFDNYIEAHKLSGIHHFNYGPGSPFNRKQDIQFDLHNRHLLKQDSDVNPKLIIEYSKDIKVALYEHTVAMFSFFTKEILEKVGLIDEQFFNAWEHVDHTYRIIKAGYHPPFWWFADLANSHKLLTEAPGAIDNSSIANKSEEWAKNVYGGRELYFKKHGHYPNQPPFVSKEEVIKCIQSLKNNNSIKTTYSQYGQDLFVLKTLKNKKNGTFIEIGAYDGIDCSNTYLLETEYNWSGVCIEPNTNTFKQLQKNRKSILIDKPVSNISNKKVYFKEHQGWSHITNNNDSTTIETTTICLNDIFKNYSLPNEVDYLSLDVEGEEYNILTGFDFTKYKFKVITVEHNAYYNGPEQKNKIREILTKNDYTFIKSNEKSSTRPNDWPENIDDYYIHNSILK